MLLLDSFVVHFGGFAALSACDPPDNKQQFVSKFQFGACFFKLWHHHSQLKIVFLRSLAPQGSLEQAPLVAALMGMKTDTRIPVSTTRRFGERHELSRKNWNGAPPQKFRVILDANGEPWCIF